jgi:predicted short-subunit dehydrogenase-like oxidoreductase (DUF2520 family)
MGRALGLRLVASGYPVRAVASRTRAAAEALAQALGAPVATERLGDVPEDAPLVALCVPDGEIAAVAAALAAAPRSWRGAVVLHTSGATPAAALDPLRERGARTLAFHPLQAVTRRADGAALAGATAGIEGPPPGVAAGVELAAGLGMRPLVVSAEAKPRYHLAAAMASNLLVTLLAMAQEVLASIGIDRQEAAAALAPLLRGTLGNVARSSPEGALTGPVARGDLATLRAHGLALREHLPHLVPVYAALSAETVRLAVRAGTLAPAQAEEVLSLLGHMEAPAAPRGPALGPEEGG